jgi:hypothetical protein
VHPWPVLYQGVLDPKEPRTHVLVHSLPVHWDLPGAAVPHPVTPAWPLGRGLPAARPLPRAPAPWWEVGAGGEDSEEAQGVVGQAARRRGRHGQDEQAEEGARQLCRDATRALVKRTRQRGGAAAGGAWHSSLPRDASPSRQTLVATHSSCSGSTSPNLARASRCSSQLCPLNEEERRQRLGFTV